MKKTRFLFSLLMAIAMMAMSPMKMWALGGSGTSGSPYTIASADDLKEFADIVNGTNGKTRNVAACAKLTADINLGNAAWKAMGSSSYAYTGTFDGQGHTISGFSMEGYTKVNAGFFGYVEDATIKNFTLNGTMTSSTQITSGENDCSGAVVGRAMGSSTIQDIVSNVNITLTKAQKHLGGVVGAIEGSTVVKGCTYTGTLDAGPSTDCIGGIVGFAPASCSGSIFYCFFNGTLSSSSSTPTMGGILGYTNDESNNFSGVHDCYSCGTFSFGASDYKYVNAIVGRIRNRATTTINNTYLSGTATRACNTDGPSIPASNKAITISVTAGANGTVRDSYVNPSTEQATQLQVVATPNAHYHFNKWDDNGAQTHNVGLTANVSLTASFAIDKHQITVATNSSTMGTVSGGGTYDWNSKQTIKATAKTHYHFVEWNDGNTNASRSITVTEDKTYTATFAIDQHTISVATNNVNYGTVSGGGTFDYNSKQTITATPKEHYHFVQWNDGVKTASRQITVTGDKTYTATFAPNPYTITVNVASGQSAMGTVSGGGTYNYGTQQTITATPEEHYHFVQWSDGNTDASRQIMVNGNATYTATFAIDQHTITVQANNDDYGTVSGSGTFDYNSQQTITATPEEHYHFVQWNDGNTDASRTITVTDDAQQNTYTATFAIDRHTIIVKANNGNYGTVTGGGTFDYNSQQTITATPNAGYYFTGWSDGNTDNPRTITVSGEATYTATFGKPKAVLDGSTLTFYCDAEDHSGWQYDLNTGENYPAWADRNKYITSIVFDESFQYARPTSCYRWFQNCQILASITGIEYLNTEEVTNMQQMFASCNILSSIDLSHFNTAKVENMSSMFYNCWALTSLNFSSFNTVSVTNMESMFQYCGSLTSLDLSNFNTEKVTNMSTMFMGLNLTSLNLSSFNTEKVKYMNDMFNSCPSLTSLDLSSFNTSSVLSMSRMFRYCSTLQSLVIVNFDMREVVGIGLMFEGCNNLNMLTLKSIPFLADGTFNTQFTGDGKTVNVILDDNSVIYEGTNYLPTITNCNHYNQWGEDLICTVCHQPAAITHTGTCGTCTWTIYENGHMIIEPTEGESGTLAYWGEESFAPWLAHDSEIKSVEFRGEVIASTCYRLFFPCNYLRNIDFKGFNTANVTNMKQMFAACKSLQTLDLSSFNTANVSDMVGMFQGCSSLQSLDLSSFNTVNVNSMATMFEGCTSLQSLDLSSFNTANVESMALMFYDCFSLATLKLSNDFVLNEGVDKENLFDGCGTWADQLLIYYVIDESIKDALQSGTTFGGDFRGAKFVPSAIVKDGVPFNVTIARGSCFVPAEDVVFTRTFTAEKPASVMLPFEVEASQISGATFYEFKGVTYDTENSEWVATMQTVPVVWAYKPYVVITSGTGITFTGYSIMFQSTEVVNGNMTQTDPETGWTFVALNEFKRWEAGDEEIGKAYGFAGKNKDYDDYSVAKGEFVKIGAGASAKPGRCYLIKNDGGPLAAKGMRRAAAADELPSKIKVRFINSDDEDEATGIAELNTETGEMSEVQWYDLNGRRIEKPAKGGIYIKNNKKVMVK